MVSKELFKIVHDFCRHYKKDPFAEHYWATACICMQEREFWLIGVLKKT